MDDTKESTSSGDNSRRASYQVVQVSDDADHEERSVRLPQPAIAGPSTFRERLVARACSNHPQLCLIGQRVLLYVRGPRPKTDLPGKRAV